MYRCASRSYAALPLCFLSHDDLPRRRKDSVPSSTSAPFASLSPEGRAPTPRSRGLAPRASGLRRRCRRAAARAARHGPPSAPRATRPLLRLSASPTPTARDHPLANLSLRPPHLPRARPQAPPPARRPQPPFALPGRPQPGAMRPLCRATSPPRRPPRGWISSPRRLRQAGAPVRFHARRRRRGVLRVVRMGDVPGDGSRPTAGHGRVRTRDHGGGADA